MSQPPADLAGRLSGLSARKRELLGRALSARVGQFNAFPLSYAQQRLWFLDQLEPGNPAYTIPGAVRIQGPVQVDAIGRALEEIARRHEVLRSVLLEIGGKPMQVVRQPAHVPLAMVDLSSAPAKDRPRLAHEQVTRDLLRPFDLARGPLIRAALIRLDAQDHVLSVLMHHAVSDGWSLGILIRELAALYRAFAAGQPSPLPPLPLQYADYAQWQRRWLEGRVLGEQMAWWKERLAGLSPLELLPDHPRPVTPSHRGGARVRMLPQELSGALKLLARKEGATLFMVLLAAFKALLWRYCGQEDLAVGSPIAGRGRAELEGLIGFFVNTLVLRTNLSGNPTFRELLARVKATAVGAYAHQELPFEKLVEAVRPERDLGRNPLFQVAFALQNAPMPSLQLSGLTLTTLDVPPQAAPFDLTLSVTERMEGLELMLIYSADLFEPDTAYRMLAHLHKLLEAAVARPHLRLSELPLLSEHESRRVLYEWNATRRPFLEQGLHELVEAQAERTPDVIAASCEGAEITYGELNRRANALARHLLAHRVGPEKRVGLFLERSPDMLVAILGTLKAGAVCVPLDPVLPQERIAFMLKDAGVSFVLSQQALEPKLPPQPAPVLCLDGDWDRVGLDIPGNAAGGASADGLAYVIYTSGTTGQPKGVMLPHCGLAHFTNWISNTYPLGPEDRVLFGHSFGFDAAILDCFWPLASGARVVMVAPERERDPAYQARVLVEQQVTAAVFVPSLLQAVLEEPGLDGFPGLKYLLSGGEPLTVELAKRVHARIPCELYNVFGPTETSVGVTAWACDPDAESERIPIGRPIANAQVVILDRYLRPVPVGVPGELFVGGMVLARGYLGQPDLTAERFVPNPFSHEPGARLYRTGDLARWLPDGNVDYLGRVDDQVKVRGHRIELGEVEAVLLAHEEVREAAVVMREWAGDRRLAAYVVPRNGAIAAQELRRHLRTRLPEYMVPAAFVSVPSLPRAPNGKLDARALPAPQSEAPPVTAAQAPRTPVQEVVAGIFAQVLGLPRVGTDESFFDLGGHSLLASQVVSRLRSVLGAEVPLRAVFETPTVAGIAARIEPVAGVPAQLEPPTAASSAAGPEPLSLGQEGMWLAEQVAPGSPAYHVPLAARLEGPVRADVLERCLAELVRRHEALRTTFVWESGQPAQVVQAPSGFSLVREDLSTLTPEDRDAEAIRRVTAEITRPFDLAKGPLVRGLLLREGDDRHVLVLCLHHIVTDGWAVGLLGRELVALYVAFQEECPSPLPEPPMRFADFARWQRQALESEALQEKLAWWREHLAGLPVLALPADRPRTNRWPSRGLRRVHPLPAALVDELAKLAHGEGATLFMVALAGFEVLLHRYSGQPEVVVGSPFHGRTRTELEGLVGLFANSLVLRGDLSGGPSFRDLLARVRDETLRAYAHADVPFEKVVEVTRAKRQVGRAPLFQVMFALQSDPLAAPPPPGFHLEALEHETGSARFELTMNLWESARGLRASLDFDADLFEPSTIERMLAHYEQLLRSAVDEPGRRIDQLRLLSDDEAARALLEWNATAAEYPRDQCVHQLVEQQRQRTPDAVALEIDGAELTYKLLDRRANYLAQRLRTMGVGPEVRVGLCGERSVEWVIALLGILKAGGACVPLEPGPPPEQLQAVLDAERPALLLGHRRLLGQLPPHEVRIIYLEELGTAGADYAPWSGVAATHLAFVLERVHLTHRGLVNALAWRMKQLPLTGEDRCFVQDASSGLQEWLPGLFHPLSAGARLVLGTPDWQRVTALFASPAALQAYLDRPDRPAYTPLRQVFCQGEDVSAEMVARFLAEVIGVSLHRFYGPVEVSLDALSRSFEPGSAPQDSSGNPIANMQAYVLGSDLRSLPTGIGGELYLGGVGLGRMYSGLPELTAARFVPDPFGSEPGARLFKTGRRARRLADGSIELIQPEVARAEPPRPELVGPRSLDEEALCAIFGQLLGVEQVGVHDNFFDLGGHSFLAVDVIARVRSTFRLELPLRALFEHPTVAGLAEQIEVERSNVATSAAPPLVMGVPNDPLPLSVALGDAPIASSDSSLSILEPGAAFAPAAPADAGETSPEASAWLVAPAGVAVARADEQAQAAAAAAAAEITAAEPPPPAEPPAAAEAPAAEEAPPVQPAELPLSLSQQRLWFLDRLTPKSPVYNLPSVVLLAGPLKVGLLERSLQEIVWRHQVLRAVFTEVDGQPSQRVQDGLLKLVRIDLSHLELDEAERQARSLARQDALAAFDLAHGPLLRAAILRIGADKHLLLVSAHHIVFDAASMAVLVRELAALYEALAAGQPPELPELPFQYADFAAQQRRWLQEPEAAEQLAWWTSRLEGVANLPLTTDHPRPPIPTPTGQTLSRLIPEPLVRQLQALARAEGGTLFMVLLAAFKVLLHRYTAQEDIAVSTPTSGRTSAELEALIGPFANTLVIRTQVRSPLSFRKVLGAVRETTLHALAHQEIPFERLVEALRPERNLARPPLAQVGFALQASPVFMAEGAGLTLALPEAEVETAKLELTLVAAPDEEGLALSLELNRSLFEPGTVRRMLGHLQTLLEAIVEVPDRPAGNLRLLSEAEQRRVLFEWNGARLPFLEITVPQLVDAQVEHRPDGVAVSFGDERMTYAALARRSNQLARYLVACGVGTEVRVALHLEHSPEMVVAMLAVLQAGGVCVPVDPALPREQISFIVKDARAAMAITTERFLPAMTEASVPVLCVDREHERITAEKASPLYRDPGAEALAFILYTSGTTGRPRGVLLPHRGLSHLLLRSLEDYPRSEHDKVLQLQSFGHDLGIWECFGSLAAGAELVMAEPDRRRDAAYVVQLIAEAGVTVATFVPSMLRRVVEEPGLSDCTALRLVFCGGDALSHEVMRRFFARHPAPLHLLYGSAETSVMAATWQGEREWRRELVPLGRAIADTQIYVLDARLQPVPVDVPGELYVGGLSLARGYAGSADLTAERFIPNPFAYESGERLYRTGDVGRWLENGALELLGRVDAQVKVRGNRVDPAEVQAVLVAHPQVREAAAVPMRLLGSREKQLVAYVVPVGTPPTFEELRAFLQASLPEYMLPAATLFLDALPLTLNGKLDVRALPPPDEVTARTLPAADSRDALERQVAEVFRDVLGSKRVGLHDGFFDLGGDSLRAVRLVSRLQEVLGRELPLARVFQGATVARIAAWLREEGVQVAQGVTSGG